MRIAIHSPFAADEIAAAIRNQTDVSPVVARTKDELRDAMQDADALAVTASLYDEATAAAVASAARLRWIHFVTSGVDPLTRFPSPDVPVTNSAAAWAPTVAEHAVALLLALQRRLPAMAAAQRRGEWAQLALRPALVSLESSTVLLLGFGEIGQRIAQLIKPFGARVIAVARTGRRHSDVEAVVDTSALDALLPKADALIAALPGDSTTAGLINVARLALLPSHAVVVNVGRGETFDEAALAQALRAGRLAGAGLDVFEQEPLPAASALWSLDNAIVSPHVAGMGRSRLFERLASMCADNARRLVEGRPLAGLVGGVPAR